MAKRGLYANIHAKRKRIKAGSKEKMRKKGEKGAPTSDQLKRAQGEAAQDPDIKDKEGTQPKKYYSGIKSKSTKSARDAHFKKGTKMDDDNPAAYKPAPGDKTAKTKTSVHTKRFKQMFDESEMQAIAKKKINDKYDFKFFDHIHQFYQFFEVDHR